MDFIWKQIGLPTGQTIYSLSLTLIGYFCKSVADDLKAQKMPPLSCIAVRDVRLDKDTIGSMCYGSHSFEGYFSNETISEMLIEEAKYINYDFLKYGDFSFP